MIRALVACWTIALAPADVARVVDGDTFDLGPTAVWPGIAVTGQRIRLLGVDAPERGDSLYAAAGRHAAKWFAQDTFQLTVCKRDAFGRALGIVTRGRDTLAASLIAAGLGVHR